MPLSFPASHIITEQLRHCCQGQHIYCTWLRLLYLYVIFFYTDILHHDNELYNYIFFTLYMNTNESEIKSLKMIIIFKNEILWINLVCYWLSSLMLNKRRPKAQFWLYYLSTKLWRAVRTVVKSEVGSLYKPFILHSDRGNRLIRAEHAMSTLSYPTYTAAGKSSRRKCGGE